MKKTILPILVSAILGLSACEATREQFDFSKKAPDEFAVVTRAPLEMPGDFTLPPPRPGQPRPQEQATDTLALHTILGPEAASRQASGQGVSEGESLLLKRTGAASTDPAIRQVIDRETAEIEEESLPGIDKLRSMVGQEVNAPAKVVDPVAETERIRQNKAEGKPLTAGETPTRER